MGPKSWIVAAAVLAVVVAVFVLRPRKGVNIVTGVSGPAESAGAPANCVPSVLHAAPLPETLTATVVPPGFGLLPFPGMFGAPNGLLYSQGPVPELVITRTFTTAPAQAALTNATVTTTATVGGSPAILGNPGGLGGAPVSGPSVAFAWKPDPNVTLEVSGDGPPTATVQAFANGVVWKGGFYPVKACATGKPQVVGPPISLAAALAKVPKATAAKLARTSEYYDIHTGVGSGTSACLQECDPSDVVWVVASNGTCPRTLGEYDGPPQPPSPTPAPAGPCWFITTLNASTGGTLPDGNPEGPGPLPSWWATLTDYSQ